MGGGRWWKGERGGGVEKKKRETKRSKQHDRSERETPWKCQSLGSSLGGLSPSLRHPDHKRGEFYQIVR